MGEETKHLYEFGPFRLDATERSLSCGGQPVTLTPKALDTLLVLVQKRGRLLDKDELLQKIWPDSFVEEATLAQNIFKLRKILGEDENGRPYIETIPKRGYRFVAEVRETRVSGVGDQVSGVGDWVSGRTGVGGQVSGDGKTGVGKTGVGDQVSGTTGVGDWVLVDSPDFRTSVNRYPTPDTRHPIPDIRHPTRSARHPTPGTRHPTFLIVFLLLIGLAVGAIYLWYWGSSKRTDRSATTRTIAVLPFKLVVGTGGDEYLGLGMADALITRLGNIKQIIVRPTSAVRRYADAVKDATSAGRELKVDLVLDGSIQRLGDRIRVTVQLVNVRDGAPLWTEKFNEKFTDMFAIQDSVSEQVERAMMLRLSGEEKKRLTKRYTEKPEAYQAYLKGRYHWNKRTAEGFKKAIEYFQQAIDLDSNYALAYAGQADCYVLLAPNNVLPSKEVYPRAKRAALKALEIDETLAEAHTSLAFVKLLYDWDWMETEKEFRRAVELNPNYPTARHWYAYYLSSIQRMDEAIAEIKRAEALDPLSLVINSDVAQILYFARRYDEAIEQCGRTLELDPSFRQVYWYLGLLYEQKGMPDKAVGAFLKQIAPSEGSSKRVAALGEAYRVMGMRGYWRKQLELTRERSKQQYISPFSWAVLYARAGEKDKAFEWLEKAYEEHYPSLVFVKTEPVFDSLRSDPRFTVLIRRVGLAP